MIELLFFLQLKHFLVDWVLQTDYQIEHKGQYMHPGGLIHSLQHGALTAVALVAVGAAGPLQCLAAGALDMVIHYHVDWGKQNLSRGLTPADKRFWVLMGADQLAHQLTYLLIVFLLY